MQPKTIIMQTTEWVYENRSVYVCVRAYVFLEESAL